MPRVARGNQPRSNNAGTLRNIREAMELYLESFPDELKLAEEVRKVTGKRELIEITDWVRAPGRALERRSEAAVTMLLELVRFCGPYRTPFEHSLNGMQSAKPLIAHMRIL